MGATQLSGFTEPTAATNDERRAWVRHDSTQQTLCQQSYADVDDFWVIARVRDISQGGLCLILNRPFPQGAVLAIEPVKLGNELKRAILAEVVHAQAGDAGRWVLGCAFTSPLTEDELSALL